METGNGLYVGQGAVFYPAAGRDVLYCLVGAKAKEYSSLRVQRDSNGGLGENSR